MGGGGGVGSSPLASFTKLRKLGEGGFGKVFLVRDARDGVTYVMKEIDLTKLDAKGRKEATKECAFLSRMRSLTQQKAQRTEIEGTTNRDRNLSAGPGETERRMESGACSRSSSSSSCSSSSDGSRAAVISLTRDSSLA